MDTKIYVTKTPEGLYRAETREEREEREREEQALRRLPKRHLNRHPELLRKHAAQIIDERKGQLRKEAAEKKDFVKEFGPNWSGQRCGAKCKRSGKPCPQPAMKRPDGVYTRCKMHGGRSTGPKTEAGKQRIAQANRRRKKPSTVKFRFDPRSDGGA